MNYLKFEIGTVQTQIKKVDEHDLALLAEYSIDDIQDSDNSRPVSRKRTETPLPGTNSTIIMEHKLSLNSPYNLGDTLTTKIEVLEFDPATHKTKLKTTCVKQDGIVAVEGFITISFSKADC